jgi:hypothetical protein
MAKAILVVGESGTGKSRALLNLDPATTVILSPNRKDLPFKGGASMYNTEKQNFFKVPNFESLKKMLEGVSAKMPHVKCIIIED